MTVIGRKPGTGLEASHPAVHQVGRSAGVTEDPEMALRPGDRHEVLQTARPQQETTESKME